MLKRKKIINIIKEKNNDITEEMLNILILIIESFDIIRRRHINMLLSNNLNFIYINKNEIRNAKILYIEFIIKNNNPNIFIYERFGNKNKIPIINKTDEFDNYSLISIYIDYDNEKIQNVYNIEDFRIIIRDIKSMLSLKLILNTKSINLSDIYKSYICSPLEEFYIVYFLNNKKEKIINEYYKISINFSTKYKNKNKFNFYVFWEILKNKIFNKSLNYKSDISISEF